MVEHYGGLGLGAREKSLFWPEDWKAEGTRTRDLSVQALLKALDNLPSSPQNVENRFGKINSETSMKQTALTSSSARWTSAAFLSVLLGATLATAQPAPGAPQPTTPGGVPPAIAAPRPARPYTPSGPLADLTEEQETAVREAFAPVQKENAALLSKLTPARKELNEALFAEPVNEATIREKAMALGNIESEIALNRARALAKVRSVLKPDQLAKLKSMGPNVLDRLAFPPRRPMPQPAPAAPGGAPTAPPPTAPAPRQ